MWYRFWKRFFLVWLRWQCRFRVEGAHHEPAAGPVLVVANHTSAADPVLVAIALRRRVITMGKEELFRVPVLGWWLRSLGGFPVRRGEPDRRALHVATRELVRGGVVVIFPEGTRSIDGRLQSAEPGAALLALRTGATVLPVAVVGAHRMLPKGARLPRPQPIVVRLGPPLHPPRLDGRIARDVLDVWGQRFIQALAALLPPDQQPPGPLPLPPARATGPGRSAPGAGR